MLCAKSARANSRSDPAATTASSRYLLGEPSQLCHDFRRGLNLVEEQDCFVRRCADIQHESQVVEDAPGVALEIDFEQNALLAHRDIPHQPGFPHLPGAANDQRQTRLRSEPFPQESGKVPLS